MYLTGASHRLQSYCACRLRKKVIVGVKTETRRTPYSFRMQTVSRLAFLELMWHQAATTTVFSVQESQQLSIGKRMAQMQEVQGTEWVPELVNANSGKLLVPSHSYLSRKVQHQCIEHVFRDKLPASYHLQN